MAGYTHRYRFCDAEVQAPIGRGCIALLQLPKFAVEQVETEEGRWLKVFVEGEHPASAHLQTRMKTPEMEKVMSTFQGRGVARNP